jgi:hypothetical protein
MSMKKTCSVMQKVKHYCYFLSLVCASVIALFLFTGTPNDVYAGSVHLGSATVITPKPPAVESYEASSRMQFNVRYNFLYCGNTYPTARGRMSQPVPVDQPHTAFGPERVSDTLLGAGTGNINPEYRYSFNSTYTQNFTAPATPGMYKFIYQVGARNAQGTDRFFSGEVRFLVRARDMCTNMDGLQEIVPANHYGTTNADGEAICLNEDGSSGNLICVLDNSPIIMGTLANFSARMTENLRGTFFWYDGATSDGSAAKRDVGVVRSVFSKFYNVPGVYQVTTVFEGQNGVREECVVGVRVYPNSAVDALPTSGDGVVGFLDPNAPPAVIDFTFQNALTNTTCRATWNAQNVLGCQLFRNDDFFMDVNSTGTLDLIPGSYQLQCVQLKDGATVSSELAICRKNIDTREI